MSVTNAISVKLSEAAPRKLSAANTPQTEFREPDEFGARGADEINVENKQLRRLRDKMAKQIEEFNKAAESIRKMAFSMLEKEWIFNKEIAEPIAKKYGVHLEDSAFADNIQNAEKMVQAAHWIQYCYRPSEEDVARAVKQAKTQAENEKQYRVKLEGKLREKEEQIGVLVKQFQAELLAAKQNSGMLRTEKVKFVVKKELLSILSVEDLQEIIKSKKTQAAEPTEAKTQDNIIEAQKNASSNETKIEIGINNNETAGADNGAETQSAKKEKIKPPAAKILHETASKTETRQAKETEQIREQIREQIDQEALSKVQDPIYMHHLKEKGYDIEASEESMYDLYVRGKEGKVPLRYIDYPIERSEEFDDLMKQTDQIYLLFKTKENLNKGNTSFTSWLLKSKRRHQVAFSFTTMDQLKVSGLDELDKL